jgi:hypothetical protein
MARAAITRDAGRTTYAMPRSVGIALAALAAIVVAAAIAAFFARMAPGGTTLWTWFLVIIVTAGVLPIVLNALVPQRVTLDDGAIEARRWFGRVRIAWRDAVEALSYRNAGELFLRVRTERSRILLSTRWYAWDADDLRTIARDVDELIDEHHPSVARAARLETFPEWFSKEAGLRR